MSSKSDLLSQSRVQQILLIDDDPTSLLLMSQILIRGGYPEALTAESGKSARKMLKREPDLVIFDIELPDIDGLSLLREFRGKGMRAPAIVVSGSNDFKQVLAALENDAFWYLNKPLNGQEFLAVIQRAMQLSDLVKRSALFEQALSNAMRRQLKHKSHQNRSSQPELDLKAGVSCPLSIEVDSQSQIEETQILELRAEHSSGHSLAEIEQQAIIEALIFCGGNKAKAARRLGISEKSIYNKMRRYNLRIPSISSLEDDDGERFGS